MTGRTGTVGRMCGRFVSSSTPDEIATYFAAARLSDVLLDESYNVAPTDDVYVVVDDREGTRRLEAFHWGLVPSWAKDPKIGNRMINARSESLADKPAYRTAFQRRRCLIPADGVYEWQKIAGSKQKQPYFLHRPDDEPLAFAGLWEAWRGPEGDLLRSCAIITCGANETMAPIHDRMPVVLPPNAWSGWLDRGNHDVPALAKLLVPAPAGLLVPRPVSTDVNDVRTNDAHLVERAEPIPVPDTLT